MIIRDSEDRAASITLSRWIGVVQRFCQQWRHAYLLLALMSDFVWRMGTQVTPQLERMRVLGGLHPGEVWLLSKFLAVSWLLPAGCVVLYVGSFRFAPLNTPEGAATTALLAAAWLAWLAKWALLVICIHLAAR
jgi:hypothetical protein